MSAIGGIHSFDELPVDRGALETLGRRLVALGPDDGRSQIVSSVGMVYRAFHTTQESRREIQPFLSNSGHLLCFDGRLDNRSDLISELRNELREDHTDVALIMAAYKKWGAEFLPRLIGDFVLSLWDPSSQTLLLARDVIGSRDLYYQVNLQRILWSSDLAALLDLCDCELKVDDDYIAAHLARLPEPGQTPFKDIHAVPAAHLVRIDGGRLQSKRFWRLNPDFRIRYKSDAEYEEHFRHLFREAVQRRLRSDGPVWCDLSGGLDSSSIVCMAHQLIDRGEAPNQVLETVSYIHDEAPTSSEVKFISHIENSIGKMGHHILESQFPIFSAAHYRPSIVPNTLDIFRAYYDELSRLMSESGARVRLSGNGGDEILNSIPNPSADLSDFLIQGKFLDLHRSLKTWSQDRKKPYLKLFWQEALLPVLPTQLRVALKQGPVKRLPVWLDPNFVSRTNLQDLLLGPDDVSEFRLPSDRLQSISFLCAVRELSGGFMRVLENVDIRFPFLHRPLVEFMQAIPKEQRARLGETRSLQRRALRDLVPPEILKRKGKGNPIEALSRAISREHARLRPLLSDSYAARYGYVNQKELMTAFEKIKYGDLRSMEVFRLIPLELWLRSLDQVRSGAKVDATETGLPRALPVVA